MHGDGDTHTVRSSEKPITSQQLKNSMAQIEITIASIQNQPPRSGRWTAGESRFNQMERGTVQWNSGMVEGAINDPVPFLLV